MEIVQTTKDPDNALDMLLFNECEHHLLLIEDSRTSKLCKYTRPEFIWLLLENMLISKHNTVVISGDLLLYYGGTGG